jgi:23S rRNA (guanosine2251-2'-O)-methyltransferase
MPGPRGRRRALTGRTPAPGDPFVVLGRRAADEAVAAGSARRLLLERGARVPGLVDRARAAGVPVEEVDRARLDGVAAGVRHQGVAVEVRPPAALGERDLGERDWSPDALVVVLDGVEDPQNVGAAARVAEAAGGSALVVRERRAAGVTPAAVRASAGALLHLPVAIVANVPRALQRLKDAGFTVVGLDASAPAAAYRTEPPSGRVAVVVGGEERGLSRLAREGCDLLIALPMRGRVASLNASTALAAAVYGFLLPGRIEA